MSTLTLPVRSGGRAAQIHIDLVTLGLLSVIVLLGLVMVTSASAEYCSQKEFKALSPQHEIRLLVGSELKQMIGSDAYSSGFVTCWFCRQSRIASDTWKFADRPTSHTSGMRSRRS